ncbi:MAG: hypothetical protein HXY40_03020 [Chloroflexi bacterium]|nr:hypothetical protein [Chloroflexota bacterium]
MKKGLIAYLLLLALLAAACNFGGVGLERNADGSLNINITLSESQVNDLVSQALISAESSGRSVRVQNASVDLQPGQMVISGEYEQQNGTGNFVQGSITLAVAMVDGRVNVSVTQANIGGMEANDARLTEIAERINDALGARAQQGSSGDVRITNVTISANDLTLVINVPAGQ